MDGKSSVNTLADRVGEVNAGKLGKTLTDLIAESFVC